MTTVALERRIESRDNSPAEDLHPLTSQYGYKVQHYHCKSHSTLTPPPRLRTAADPHQGRDKTNSVRTLNDARSTLLNPAVRGQVAPLKNACVHLSANRHTGQKEYSPKAVMACDRSKQSRKVMIKRFSYSDCRGAASYVFPVCGYAQTSKNGANGIIRYL